MRVYLACCKRRAYRASSSLASIISCAMSRPTFLGFCEQGADCASKTVPKAHAHEPVGVIALAGGKPAVVEYSEISNEMAEATDKKGNFSLARLTSASTTFPQLPSPLFVRSG